MAHGGELGPLAGLVGTWESNQGLDAPFDHTDRNVLRRID